MPDPGGSHASTLAFEHRKDPAVEEEVFVLSIQVHIGGLGAEGRAGCVRVPLLHAFVNFGEAGLGLRVACEVGHGLTVIGRVDIISRAKFTQIGCRRGQVEGGLEHSAADHGPSHFLDVAGRQDRDRIPRRIGVAAGAHPPERGAGTQVLGAELVEPVVVIFAGGPVHVIFGGLLEILSGAAKFSAPLVIRVAILSNVIDLAIGHLLCGDHADPRSAAKPPDVGVVAVGLGQGAEIPHVPPENGGLILDATAGPAREQLPQRHRRAFVSGLIQIFACLVMDRDDFHAVDLIDPVAGRAEGSAAAEPLDEMTHLVGKHVAVAHLLDGGEGLVIEHALRRPEDL